MDEIERCGGNHLSFFIADREQSRSAQQASTQAFLQRSSSCPPHPLLSPVSDFLNLAFSADVTYKRELFECLKITVP